jgi:protein-S-isoprenylcysteine O-methyltransferase Ste14
VPNNSSQGKAHRAIFLIVHITHAIIRDRIARRKTMFVLLLIALFLLVSGSTFLQTALNPREHPAWFILFWLICAWLTLTAMLLAIFDLLTLRLEARTAQRVLRAKLEMQKTSNEK